MTDVLAIEPGAPVTGAAPVREDASRTRPGGFAVTALMLLPGALGLYAALTLASALWSHSSGRALIEFDRACLYLLVLILFGTVRASALNMRWLIRGLVVGASVVCLAGLISRVLPNVWHTAPNVSNERLSYPVTYWNTLGLLAALGIVLAFHLTCSLGERRLVRVLAAAVIPLLAATLFFTFSRGAIAAGSVGLVLYILVARPRGLLSGVLATAPPSVVLIVVAYHANLLDTVDPTTPAAVSQGHHVALVAGICAAACAALRLFFALGLDPRLRGATSRAQMSRRARLAAIAGLARAVLVLGLALGVPRSAEHDWRRFIGGATPHGNASDLRQRLTDPSNNGRTDLWRVALHGFSASPLHGYGAGMYQTLWDRNRPAFVYTINAHSLYLQAMAELGLVGLVLLLVAILAVLYGLGTRARGPRRSIYGALLAAGVVWALRGGRLGLGDAGDHASLLRRRGPGSVPARARRSRPRSRHRARPRSHQRRPPGPRAAVPGRGRAWGADDRGAKPAHRRRARPVRLGPRHGRLRGAVADQMAERPTAAV